MGEAVLCYGSTVKITGEGLCVVRDRPLDADQRAELNRSDREQAALERQRYSYLEAQDGERPKGIKRRRMTCPRCGRRVWSSIRTCHDGCCVYHSIKPHKPKRWWKRRRPRWTRRHPERT